MKKIQIIFLLTAAFFCLSINYSFSQGLKEADFYLKKDNSVVQCVLCPNMCVLNENKRGLCGVRENKGGKLYTLVYGRPVAVHIDPIEKKPFFHVLPGSYSFSIATVGCNMRCSFCQNWQISQARPEEHKTAYITPEQIVNKAIESNCKSIAYTYTEPAVFYEYMFDIAKLARKKGLKNVMHTCGYFQKEPLLKLLDHMDAVNVDLKSINPKFYSELTTGSLNPVLETMKLVKKKKVWLEITNLVIPTKNDSNEDIKNLCLWIKNNLGSDVPVHFTRFYPCFKMSNLTATAVNTLESAAKTAKDTGLEFIYIGNVTAHRGESTYCPECKKLLIQRTGYFVDFNKIKDSRCPYCKHRIPGIF